MPIKIIEGLSTVEEIEQKVAEEMPKEMPPRKKWVRPTIVVLVILAIVLGGFNFSTSSLYESLTGVGGVSGSVVNSNQTPVAAEIFVLTQDISTVANDQGQFVLSGIPSGGVTLIVAYQGIGKEIPVSIKGGEVLAIGQVMVEETQMPSGRQP
jgi:hypothetical protein